MTPSTLGVVTVTHNGLDHLKSFVPALTKHTSDEWPLRLLVIDNASTDGTDEWLKNQNIETIRLDSNHGFAQPNNLGVEKLDDCEYVALLNNDTQVCNGWSTPMIEALNADPSIVAAGALLTDWTGEKIDFAGGVVSFSGHAHQTNQGKPVSIIDSGNREVLFVCGGAMIVRRSLFLELGGFDPDFFAYFEDVDFGWRAWMAGYRIVLTTASRVMHRHQGTAGRLPFPPRMRLYERNALCTVLKNYEESYLWPALAASLLAVYERMAAYSSFDYRGLIPSDPLPPKAPAEGNYAISALSGAQLLAVADLAEQWDFWMQKRTITQQMRKKADRDLFPLFGDMAIPPLLGDETYAKIHRLIVENMHLDLFTDKAS